MCSEPGFSLLARGACLDCTDASGRTALWCAVDAGNRALRDRMSVNTDLVNQADHDQVTALHRAVERGNADIARWLIEKGAQADAVTVGGNAALMLGAVSASAAINELLDAGAQGNLKNKAGSTALMLAAQAQRKAVVERLLPAWPSISSTSSANARRHTVPAGFP